MAPLISASSASRTVVVTALISATVLCWLWIVPMALDMYGPMTGPSAWMMTSEWDPAHLVLLWSMWAVMMAGMMLPTAMPVILLYAAAGPRAEGAPRRASNAYAIAGGYLLVWSVFSVAATMLQRLLSEQLLLTPMMESAAPAMTAVLLLIAGVYQITPLKSACLRTCRSPLAMIMQRHRPGRAAAFQIGVEHGLYCLGCCWALMLLLFAGGVMNLIGIASLTSLVLIEKLTPLGPQAARISGLGFIAWAIWLLVTR